MQCKSGYAQAAKQKRRADARLSWDGVRKLLGLGLLQNGFNDVDLFAVLLDNFTLFIFLISDLSGINLNTLGGFNIQRSGTTQLVVDSAHAFIGITVQIGVTRDSLGGVVFVQLLMVSSVMPETTLAE